MKAKAGPEMPDEVLKSALAPKAHTRRVFISHAHADRELGTALSKLLEHAFSGTVEPYFSSDPSPGGGIQPGDEWYSRIHEKLAESESVWVLATMGSISRPWLYWEAGIGRAVCPGGIVVLRVGIKQEEVPSPLSAYQSYDGLSVTEGGVSELLGKIGEQIGLNVQDAWLKTCAAEFVKAAKEHRPNDDEKAGEPRLAPEDVSRIDGLVNRLEVVARRIESARQGELDEEESAVARTKRAKQERRRKRVRVTGSPSLIYGSPEELLELVARLRDADIKVRNELDDEGDVVIEIERGGETVRIYLRITAEELEKFGSVDEPQQEALLTVIRDVFGRTAPLENDEGA